MLASYYPKQMPVLDEELESILKEHNATVVNKAKEATDQGPQPAQRQPLALEAKALSDQFYAYEEEFVRNKKYFTDSILEAARNGKRGVKVTITEKTAKASFMQVANENKLRQWLKDERFSIGINMLERNVWEVTW